MTITEARLRGLLQELAEDAQPAVLLGRLDRRAPAFQRRRIVMVAVAAAAVVAVAVSTVLVQSRLSSMPQPADQPGEVLELGTTRTTQPGRAWFALTVAGANHAVGTEIPAFVVPADAGTAAVVPPSATRPTPFTQRLSADGTRLVRSRQTNVDPTPIEVLDLTNGEVLAVDLGPAAYVYSAELSPDNESLAVYLDGEVRVVDLDTGAVTTVHRQPRFLDSHEFAPGQGWSPDGRRLVVHNEADLLVMDAGGELQEVLAGVHLVNGSQSWSPDGRSVLGYDQHANAFEVVPVGGRRAAGARSARRCRPAARVGGGPRRLAGRGARGPAAGHGRRRRRG